MSIRRSNLSWITVSDIKKAENFFANLLGLDLLEKNAEYKWLEFAGKDGGSKLGIGEDSGSADVKPGSNAIMTFTVDNIEEAKKNFEEKGVKFLGPIEEVAGQVKLVLFVDEDGNKFQLVEELSA